MRYLLDTDICVYLIRRRSESVIAQLRRCEPGDVAISTITVSELEYGAQKSAAPLRNRLALAGFLAPLLIIPYDDVAAARYGTIRAALERQGVPIGGMDMLIAAHAVACQLTLITNNEREFRRVPGLKVANWADA